jgi:hypothetical protein
MPPSMTLVKKNKYHYISLYALNSDNAMSIKSLTKAMNSYKKEIYNIPSIVVSISAFDCGDKNGYT